MILPVYKQPQLSIEPAGAPGTLQLNLTTEPPKRYRIEWTAVLGNLNDAWQPLGTNSFTATETRHSFQDVVGDAGRRFYRALMFP